MMIHYNAALEDPGDSGCDFGVVIVEAPGCFSAGETKEEAMKNAEEAPMAYLQYHLEEDGEILEPDTGASWDDFNGPKWEKFTVSVKSDNIQKATKVRRLFEHTREKALRIKWAAFGKPNGKQKEQRRVGLLPLHYEFVLPPLPGLIPHSIFNFMKYCNQSMSLSCSIHAKTKVFSSAGPSS